MEAWLASLLALANNKEPTNLLKKKASLATKQTHKTTQNTNAEAKLMDDHTVATFVFLIQAM